MKRKKILAAVLLTFVLLYAAGFIYARGESEKDTVKPQRVEVSGRVRMVGSSPMTSLVISGETREWYVEAAEKDKLMHLQQQTVTVRAQEYYQDMVFANGLSAGRHYYLKNITVVSPKIKKQ
jgi:hypothetical protein